MFQRKTLLLSAFFFLTSISGYGVVDAVGEIPVSWRQNLTLKHDYYHYRLNLDRFADQFFELRPAEDIPAEDDFWNETTFCAEDEAPSESLSAETAESGDGADEYIWDINHAEIRRFLRDDLAPMLRKDPMNVVISRDDGGNIVFEGYPSYGEELDVEVSAMLIEKAAKNGINMVTLAVKRTDPVIEVRDEELKNMGIETVLSIGWSDFSGSPHNRIHNITVGANRFSGVLIPKGEEFSFLKNLGPVDGSTGYLKELVIIGPKVVPEYGGGLCQVSTTTYRGAMLAGLPITQRRNHSFNVHYYHPVGSDATVYTGSTDFRFLNDTPGAILLQTRVEGNNLYYYYYGTRDGRNVALLGPYESNYRGVPAPKYTTSATIPVGTSEKLSNAVPGLDAVWFRRVVMPSSAEVASDGPRVAGINGMSGVSENGTTTDIFGDALMTGLSFTENISGEVVTIKTEDNIIWQTFFSRYQSRGLWIVSGGAGDSGGASGGEETVPADGSWIN